MTTTLRGLGRRFLSVSIPTVTLWGALLGSAQAAPVLILDSDGTLLGADGVNVNDASYNVRFLDGTCVALFNGCDAVTDFTFQTAETANAAAQALLDQVFLDGPLGSFDTSPGLTKGCGNPFSCRVFVPSHLNEVFVEGVFVDEVFVAIAHNHSEGFADLVHSDNASQLTDTNDSDSFVYAVFTRAAPVPEPATLTLLGLGCAGLGIARRRRRG